MVTVRSVQSDLSRFGVTSLVNCTPRFLRKVSLYLSILATIENKSAREVADVLRVKYSTMAYHFKRLEKLGIVVKKGYGVWEVAVKDREEVILRASKDVQRKYPLRSQRSGGVLNAVLPELSGSNSVRTHGVQCVVKVPVGLRGWSRRKEYLKREKIDFRIIPQGEVLFMDGCRIWLTSKSIVIWLPRSWFVPNADTGYSYAVSDMRGVIRKLERLLKVSFSKKGVLMFRVSRQHHALVKNELAIQYNREKKELYVFDQRGLWLLIDDSEGLAELEGVGNRGLNGKESRDNITHIQRVFNEFKSTGVTPQMILDMIASNTSEIKNYAENVSAHVQAVKDISEGIKELSSVVNKLRETIDTKEQ